MNLKSQKGSITLFVLVSCLFFLASVACVNVYTQNKQIAVDREYRQVKANYEKDINNMESIYRDLSLKNNLEVQFGAPEFDKTKNKIFVNVFANLEYLNINTLKYGFYCSNENINNPSINNITNWTYVEVQNGENEFVATIDLQKDNNNQYYTYYYLCIVIDNKEYWLQLCDYVESGMVLHLDGINNAGLGDKNHNSSATTWKNLCSEDHDGVLLTTGTTGPVWENDHLVFDGVDDWVGTGVINTDYQSIEAVYSISSNKNYERNIIGDWEGAGGGIAINSQNKPFGDFHIGGYKIVTGNGFIIDKIYSSTVTYDGHKVIFYINGTKIGEETAEGGTITNDPSTAMAIGANPGGNTINPGTHFLDGKVYSARVYNRALTADEVKQNYIADNNRFKIQD